MPVDTHVHQEWIQVNPFWLALSMTLVYLLKTTKRATFYLVHCGKRINLSINAVTSKRAHWDNCPISQYLQKYPDSYAWWRLWLTEVKPKVKEESSTYWYIDRSWSDNFALIYNFGFFDGFGHNFAKCLQIKLLRHTTSFTVFSCVEMQIYLLYLHCILCSFISVLLYT